MYQIDFDAIGTKWFIDLVDIDQSATASISNKIKTLVKDFEDKYSRFKDTSDIGILNIHKILTNPSKELLEMLNIGKELNKLTKGSFNLLVGRQLSELGYDKSLSFRLNNLLGIDKLELGFDKLKVKLGQNSLIDLGGIGKGYIIDKVATLIKDNGFKDFSINAGGDIYVSGESERMYYLENPFDNNQAIGEISLKLGSIACSSPSKRNWKVDNQVVHHLIDMKTKKPVSDIVSVFTFGKTTTQTDLGSTAIFVSDPDLWADIAKYLQIEFLVVFSDGRYFQTSEYPGRMYLE